MAACEDMWNKYFEPFNNKNSVKSTREIIWNQQLQGYPDLHRQREGWILWVLTSHLYEPHILVNTILQMSKPSAATVLTTKASFQLSVTYSYISATRLRHLK